MVNSSSHSERISSSIHELCP